MAGISKIKQASELYNDRAKGPSNFLKVRKDDVVLFYFVGDGSDSDQWFELYLAHAVPGVNGALGDNVYCPVQSEHDLNYRCGLCAQNIKLKKRMMFWMYIDSILHKTVKADDDFPKIKFQGEVFYREVVNESRIWDTSAWRESPLDEILHQYGEFGSHQANQKALWVTGDARDRRYRVRAITDSAPLSTEISTKVQADCEPIINILKARNERISVVSELGDDSSIPDFDPGWANSITDLDMPPEIVSRPAF